MSKRYTDTVTCPKCGQVSEYTVWESLNGDLDPEAKQQLIGGTLFDFECSKCGHKSVVDYTILYHDMAHKLMAYYVNNASVKQTNEIINNAEDVIGFKIPGYHKRVVTDRNTLREKAIIFEHGLDDRIVEIIKLFYLAQGDEQLKDANITDIYFLVSDNKYILEFIGDKRFSAEMPDGMYENIHNSFAERLEAAGDNDTTVDLDWAKKFLSLNRK
ncbi:MAG: CpXC domain-containing protein [Eubacterium sp.]|nr:CpXC domain-containing protein [Eubacterium sp.]